MNVKDEINVPMIALSAFRDNRCLGTEAAQFMAGPMIGQETQLLRTFAKPTPYQSLAPTVQTVPAAAAGLGH